MTRFTPFFLLSMFLLLGCSHTTNRNQARETTPLVSELESGPARIVNTIRPGNAHGNSITLPEGYEWTDREGTTVASSSGPYDGREASDAASPFAPLNDGASASEWSAAPGETANPGQAVGLDIEEPVAPVETSNVPASVVQPTEPSWVDITEPEPEPEPVYEPTSVVEPTPEPEPEPEPEPFLSATTEQVYAALSDLEGLDTWTVVPLAHFQRGTRNVAIAWPMLNSSGQPVDAMVVGVCLEQTADGSLEQCGQRWVVNERADSTTALAQALGGRDFEVVSRQASTTLSNLGTQLERLANQYVSAIDSRDRASAARAATAFVEMLPVDAVAYTDDVTQLLWTAARYGGQLVHDRTSQNGDSATLTFDARRGWITLETVRVTASPVSGSSQWVVTSYSR